MQLNYGVSINLPASLCTCEVSFEDEYHVFNSVKYLDNRSIGYFPNFVLC